MRRGGKSSQPRTPRPDPGSPRPCSTRCAQDRQPKVAISRRIDRDVRAWFQTPGATVQTRSNAVLRAIRDASIQPGVV
ncbi:MAG: hypothetical protein COS34_04590 [Lysobacterales bacterium CG02_land_8_20_14_3_00_62_12]|nr:MAG: hypothetical protein COS34_04590 [Xanthomonadales bacterium CG02_land_8_20_14_3_00_62_12]